MYDDNNVGLNIDWKKVIIRFALIVIFILLIIWLFPIPKLDTFYNRVYNDNLNSMKESAEKYFVGDKLPSNTGSSTTVKLQDMLDKKLITSFTDKNNKECSTTNSYAQVTKTENDTYVLKVQLSCDDKTDYILENLNTTNATIVCGNNESCDNNKNDNNKEANKNDGKTETDEDDDEDDDDEDMDDSDPKYDKDSIKLEYQFKKEIKKTSTSYVCPTGFAMENNVCYKYETGETIPATPQYFDDTKVVNDAKVNTTGGFIKKAEPIKTVEKVEKICPEGYTLSGDICYKYVSATVVPGSTTYSCPPDYVLNGTKCTKTIDATTDTTPGTTTYTCDKGGNLSGTQCSYAASYSGDSSSCSCPSGYSDIGGNCEKTDYRSATYHSGSKSCSCPYGYSDNGSNCVKTDYRSASYHSGSSSYGSCPSGYSASGSSCVKTYSASASKKWSNPSVRTSGSPLSVYENSTSKRVLVNKSCKLTSCTYTYYEYTANVSYSCPYGGSRSGATCTLTTSRPINNSPGYYTCSSGTLSGSQCIVKSYANKSCSTSAGYYTCSSGTLSGSQCAVKSYANKSCSTSAGYYTCSSGTLSGSQCITKSYATKNCSTSKGSYSCPSGGTLNGATCYYNATPHNTDGSTSYSCPSGYTLNGKTCTQTIDATAHTEETKYTCPSGYVQEGTTCYQYTEPTNKTTYRYSCPDGYTQSGIAEETTCTKKVESTTTYYCENADETLEGDKCTKIVKGSIKGYTCGSGYILNNDKCVKKTVECMTPQEVTNTSVTYQYKWSTESSLDGWIATGKTRNIGTSTTNKVSYEK